jgi:hypothetical protein
MKARVVSAVARSPDWVVFPQVTLRLQDENVIRPSVQRCRRSEHGAGDGSARRDRPAPGRVDPFQFGTWPPAGEVFTSYKTCSDTRQDHYKVS